MLSVTCSITFKISVTLSIISMMESLHNVVKPKPEVQSPKVKTKRTWADTKITRVTHTTHPYQGQNTSPWA